MLFQVSCLLPETKFTTIKVSIRPSGFPGSTKLKLSEGMENFVEAGPRLLMSCTRFLAFLEQTSSKIHKHCYWTNYSICYQKVTTTLSTEVYVCYVMPTLPSAARHRPFFGVGTCSSSAPISRPCLTSKVHCRTSFWTLCVQSLERGAVCHGETIS